MDEYMAEVGRVCAMAGLCLAAARLLEAITYVNYAGRLLEQRAALRAAARRRCPTDPLAQA